MTDQPYVEAAQNLVKQLKAPPQAHSVYIRTDVDEITQKFRRTLCVSWRPTYAGNKAVPATFMGYPVELVAWPDGL